MSNAPLHVPKKRGPKGPHAGLFKKGDPRCNRNGRPKVEFCIPDILRSIGLTLDPTSQKTHLELLMRKVYALALRGDHYCIGFIAERTEGRVMLPVEVEGTGQLCIVMDNGETPPPA